MSKYPTSVIPNGLFRAFMHLFPIPFPIPFPVLVGLEVQFAKKGRFLPETEQIPLNYELWLFCAPFGLLGTKEQQVKT